VAIVINKNANDEVTNPLSGVELLDKLKKHKKINNTTAKSLRRYSHIE